MLMKEQDTLSRRNSAGLAWALSGFAILTLTLIVVGWIQFGPLGPPLPPEGVFALLAFGGIPASLAMLLGLRQSLRAKRELFAVSIGTVVSPGIRIAGVGFGLLMTGVVFFVADCTRRNSLDRQWIAEAQLAVEEVLHDGNRIPSAMRQRLGPFKNLTTRGLTGPAWESSGYILRTDGKAQFDGGMIPVRIYVTGSENLQGNRNQGVVVVRVETNTQLYPFYREELTGTMEGLEFWVIHPQVELL